jgi:riboflavin biosynthesis pyrimidine reductase
MNNMDGSVFRLYPLPGEERPLKGLFLADDLRQYGRRSGRPFVYGNYVTSLDGRIAVKHPTRPGMMVPKNTANERDWRLFQELAAQADLIISSGRYLRDWADGRAQEILRVDEPEFADLREWRTQQGLSPQPDIAIISGSLRFPIPEVLTAAGRKLLVFTTAGADPERVAEIEARAGKVIVAGDKGVEGGRMIEAVAELGYSTLYNSTGPKVHHLLLADGVMDRLYLTLAHRILGGAPFSSVVEGELLDPAADMTLHAAHYDPVALDGLGQLFLSFDRAGM